MKIFLKVAGIIVGIIIVAVVGLLYFTSGLTKTTDEFFQALKQQDISKAYTYLSEEFRSTTNESEFSEFIKKNRLTKFKETSWPSRTVSGNLGELEGSVITENGGAIPLKLSFVKGDKGWKIHSIKTLPSGFQSEAKPAQMPSETKLIEMVRRDFKMFVANLKVKDFTNFRNSFATPFKNQFDGAKLKQIYKPFFPYTDQLSRIEQVVPPVFDKSPTIDDQGVLIITGHYPTKHYKVYFNQKYLYEGLSWKLVGYSLNLK